MAHAKPEHLKGLGPLFSEIRKTSVLKEKSPGCFYLKSKSVLHFHVEMSRASGRPSAVKPDRLYAHIFDGERWIEVDLSNPMSEASQKQISKKIISLLPI